jgi:hypothetical protein
MGTFTDTGRADKYTTLLLYSHSGCMDSYRMIEGRTVHKGNHEDIVQTNEGFGRIGGPIGLYRTPMAIGLQPIGPVCPGTIEGELALAGLDPDMNGLLFRVAGECGRCLLLRYVLPGMYLTDNGGFIATGYHKRVQIGKRLYYRGVYCYIDE